MNRKSCWPAVVRWPPAPGLICNSACRGWTAGRGRALRSSDRQGLGAGAAAARTTHGRGQRVSKATRVEGERRTEWRGGLGPSGEVGGSELGLFSYWAFC
jgi:hypothetical protein